MINLYNSLTRKIELFKPRLGKNVTMYVCGITPYDTTHLGHAFTYISFDVLVRYLEWKGYAVNYTQNVTDIDDDILKKAKETNRDWRELGQFWTQKFLSDLKALHIQMPTHYVKATDAIAQIKAIVQKLIKKGNAYENRGNVYFSVKSDKEYGKLSHLSREQMLLISKERGSDPNDPLKKDPLDFVLWQRSKSDEPSWDSPWGAGRPGWHIECSAMVHQHLGEQIDVHGGGRDLIFPHHESEIAQSESYTNKKPFVKYWLHTAMVMHTGEKMSKSLGNLVMISDLLKTYSPNDIRWYLLSHHYRDVWEHRDDDLDKCAKKMRYAEAALDTRGILIPCGTFEQIMDNDLNTPLALEYIYKLAQGITRGENRDHKAKLQSRLRICLRILGFRI